MFLRMTADSVTWIIWGRSDWGIFRSEKNAGKKFDKFFFKKHLLFSFEYDILTKCFEIVKTS